MRLNKDKFPTHKTHDWEKATQFTKTRMITKNTRISNYSKLSFKLKNPIKKSLNKFILFKITVVL